MQHCNVCTYEWKCTSRYKCLLGKIKPEEIQVEMPKSIPVKTSRGITMSQNNVVPLKPKKRGRKKKDA